MHRLAPPSPTERARALGSSVVDRVAVPPAAVMAALAVMVALLTPAEASRYLPTDLDGMVDASAMIVEGEVTAVDIAAGHVEPRTRVTLRVERLFAGVSPGSLLEFALPMGLLPDGTVLDIAEAPRFAPGERYLLFYKRGAWNITPVAGWSRGLYRAVEVDGRAMFASANGHCVAGVGPAGFALGARVARPVGPPGFGVSHGVEAVSGAGTACLSADEVRARLAGYLGADAIDGAPVWSATPARNILSTVLMPDMQRAAATQRPMAPVEALCSGDEPACAGGVQP